MCLRRKTKQKKRTIAPGHPPMVNIITSHKLCSRVRGTSELDLFSNNFGRKTLNIVKPGKKREKLLITRKLMDECH
jgi:hypothetical protein